jgi:hypothetical protein
MTPFAIITTALALAGCSSETEGRVVAIDVAFEGVPETGLPLGTFETKTGWHVELDRAILVLGPVYAYAPSIGEAPSPLVELFGVPKAHAHGGHDPFNGRAVRAELLEPFALDLLAPGLSHTSAIEAEAGAVDAVTVVLDGSDVYALADANGHQAWVEGTATKDGATVAFVGGLDLPEDPLIRRVENVAAAAELDDGGTLVIGARPSIWFANAHFDRLEPEGPDGRFEITATSQVRSSWYLDVRRADAYRARFVMHDGEL